MTEIVLGWLTAPNPGALAAQVAGWDDVAWEAARWIIQVHGVGPLLDQAVARWSEADALHPRLRGYLAEQHRLSGARVARLLGELAEVLAAFRDAGITAIPLKGSHLATSYYPEPGLRPMNDLDVLVRPADEARAIEALSRLGYQPIARSWKHLMLARPDAQGPIVAYDGEHPDNPRALDLHTQLDEQFWGIRYELTEEAWANSAPGTLQGAAARLLRPYVLLHHLAIHATSDTIARRVRLLHLHDIALVAAEVDRAGWQRIVDGARARREERFVYPSLLLASRYYPVVPGDVLAALRPGLPPALLRYLDASALDRLSFCNTAPTTFGEKLCWYRPGRERLAAVRHMVLPDRGEIASWYPRLARPALLPLAYARYGAQLLGYGVRRALARPRRNLRRRST